jgi:LCP family protein required for cell wall assembly
MSVEVDESWGPAVERRARRRRWPKVLAALLVVLLVVAVAYPWWLSQQVGRVDVTDLASSGRPLHVLVAGSDTRDELTAEEQAELGTGSVPGERMDTIFIMSIHRGEVALLAFPRDLWVTRCDGSTGRINVATAIDGPGCLVRTVRDASGIDIHHYLEVTFGGFRSVVDSVGGVELCLDEPISDRDAHIDLPAGCQVLDGADALGYVRVRKIDNDLMRIQRQQEFVQALAREVASPATLVNPVRLTSMVRETGNAVRVDQTMGPISMARIGWGARGLGSGAMTAHTVPVEPRTTSGGAYVLEMRVGEAEQLFAAFRDGSIFGEIEGRDPQAEAIDPSEVQVTVLNGAGISGLAATVRDELTEQGFDVVEIGNTEARDATVVRHPPGQEAAGQLVADATPGTGTLEEDADAEHVTVLLGSDAGG